MNELISTIKGSTSQQEPLRELARAYARAHALGVRLWRFEEEIWTLEYDTDSDAGAPQPSLPIGDPAPLDLAGEPAFFVEVTRAAGDDDSRASFLAAMLAREARHQAESRFFGRELAERYEEITLLYTISEVLGSVVSLEEAADSILREVVDTMRVRRAALWIHDAPSGALELIAAVGVDGWSGPVRVDDEGSITAAVFRSRTSMILEEGDVFPREETHGKGADREPFLSVPVSYTPPRGETRTIGVINLIGRTVAEGFSAGDQKLIAAIASQVGAAVENSRLIADSLRQERMVRELELAHDLQLKLLPSVEQFREYGEVAARCAPAESVGGDFYHLFRLPDGCIGVMIGDVSSHGFAAALIMALTMSAVAIHASEGDPPAEVLRRVHRTLIDELESTEMYLTLFYGVIDPNAGRLVYANAGHSHAFRITQSGQAERLGSTNPPFGLVDLDDYGETSVPWERGADLLFLFTDGLSDAIGFADGENTLARLVVDHRALDVQEILDSIFALDTSGGDVPSDDRTAVLVRV